MAEENKIDTGSQKLELFRALDQAEKDGNDRAKFCYLDEITRYDIVAKGLGCEGLFIKTEDELVKALNNSMLLKTTTVLDIQMEGLPAPEF